MSTRTFIAVPIADVLRERLESLIQELGHEIDGVKWVAPQNLHFTLKFLGNVADPELVGVCRAVEAAVAEIPAFLMHVAGVGAFPAIERPRTLWVGAGEGADPLRALQAAVESCCDDLGFPRENRTFTPHLTIGRIARGRHDLRRLSARLGEHTGFSAGALEVDQVHVIASQLQAGGPQYHVLSRASLAGSGL